jgi:uncharacterized protein YxjI
MSENALQVAGQAGLSADPFSHTKFTIKRPFFTFFGRVFRVYGPDGQLVLFVKHKIFTFKDEWNIFRDESEQVPLIRVKARKAIALNAVTDVFDAVTGNTVGTVRNKGLKSIIRDTWEILGDTEDQVKGMFAEDSNALLRRFIPLLLGHWHMEIDGQHIAKVDQVFRFFTKEFTLEITNPGKADPRFIIGCAMLALMREIMREQSG